MLYTYIGIYMLLADREGEGGKGGRDRGSN